MFAALVNRMNRPLLIFGQAGIPPENLRVA